MGLSWFLMSLSSCLGENNTTTEVSDDPRLVALAFEKNDSIPHLNEAVFTIDQDNGLVYNKDSLPYQTRIDSVWPKFTFASTAGSLLFVEEDTIYLTGADTIDFTKCPIRLLNYAANGVDSKEYTITVNVHQVDPDLYMWQRLCPQVSDREGSSQKVLIKDDVFYLFIGNGLRNYRYTSLDARAWSEVLMTGLPDDVDFRQAQCFANMFYVVNSGGLYVSEDGQDWTKMIVDNVSFVDLLFAFKNELWAMVDVDGSNRCFAHTLDGATWVIEGVVPEEFPVTDYAALSFFSRTNTPKAMVMGGVAKNGKVLNTRWCTENGKLWVNYSVEQPSFTNLTGASVIQYDDKLLMFGGVDEDNNGLNGQLFESLDEGLNWSVPDTLHNRYPEGYEVRNSPSVVVDKYQYIYLVGGRTRTKIYSDVWRTKLNKVDFVK